MTKWIAVRIAVLLSVACLTVSSPALASSLAGGFDWSNLNFSASVTITYSWSGHWEGGDEICLAKRTVTIRAGSTVHLSPPPGFTPTDFIVIKKEYSDGGTEGGFTIYDPPSSTTTTRIEVPCASGKEKIWGFYYFGATDYGPIFANTPMAMDGLDENGIPRVVVARTSAPDEPEINLIAIGHCMIATPQSVLEDPAARKVRPEFSPVRSERSCSALTFTSHPLEESKR